MSCNDLAAAAIDSLVEQHIADVIGNMPPAVILDEKPVTHTSQSERLTALHVLGVSVTVNHNGNLEWATGFGISKVRGGPVTPDTLFQAATISKPITPMAVWRWVNSGNVNLDTDANEHLG